MLYSTSCLHFSFFFFYSDIARFDSKATRDVSPSTRFRRSQNWFVVLLPKGTLWSDWGSGQEHLHKSVLWGERNVCISGAFLLHILSTWSFSPSYALLQNWWRSYCISVYLFFILGRLVCTIFYVQGLRWGIHLISYKNVHRLFILSTNDQIS